ncbi:prefoldin subunit 1 [Anticarsia gemmatalis]|uniref:prefoldin subunit 1 n=1 Tax=Anticarsia gemmatalis TaxID=129554 RepID=UPI003F75D411
MPKPLDLELRKAFMELQVKMVETSEKIQSIDLEVDMTRRAMQHVDVTRRELLLLPADTKTYEAIGRTFLLTDLEQIKESLSYRESNLTERISELTKNKAYLEKSLKESEDNIREMVQQKKEESEGKTDG